MHLFYVVINTHKKGGVFAPPNMIYRGLDYPTEGATSATSVDSAAARSRGKL